MKAKKHRHWAMLFRIYRGNQFIVFRRRGFRCVRFRNFPGFSAIVAVRSFLGFRNVAPLELRLEGFPSLEKMRFLHFRCFLALPVIQFVAYSFLAFRPLRCCSGCFLRRYLKCFLSRYCFLCPKFASLRFLRSLCRRFLEFVL